MTDAAIPEQARRPGRSDQALTLVIALDYLLANLGRFSLMPVMAILLASRGGEDGWITTGIGLFGFTLCSGLSALLATRLLPKLPYAVTLPVSMVFPAVGFGFLPAAEGPVAALVLLLVAGFGMSVHGVVVRVLIAELVAGEAGRNKIYSVQQIATNAAAALGPFIAAALYVSGDARPLLVLVAAAYVLAGVTLAVGVPRGLRPPATVGERTRGWTAGLALLRDPQSRRVTLITAVGMFGYAQFYSAFALLVALAIDSTLLRGALLGGPPVAIVFLQALVTMLVNRRLRAGTRPLQILALATLVFGIAMAFLGVGLPVVVGAVAAMAVFAVAEMLFTPMVSTAFNSISNASPLAASNLQQVAWTSGEALGSLCGGAVFLLCYQNGVSGPYWLVLAVVTAVSALPYLTNRLTGEPRRTTPERTAA